MIKPAAWIEMLACGYSVDARRKKVLAIMWFDPVVAYGDESEGSRQGNILLVSACINTVPIWADFTGDWQTVLSQPPAIKSFHMREARNLTGQFRGWKSIDRDLKIIALTDVIMRHQPHLVSCWLNRSDYNSIMHGTVPYDLRHAYAKAFWTTTIKVAEYLGSIGSHVPADYIFDDANEPGNEAVIWYAALKESAPAHIRRYMGSTPVFRKDEEVLPLQAADLVAWHKRRRKEVLGLDPEVAATLRIDDLPSAELHLTREYLEMSARKMAAIPNVSMFLEGPSAYQVAKRNAKKAKGRTKK